MSESAATVYCNGFPVTAGRDRGGWFCPHCLTRLSDPPGDHVAVPTDSSAAQDRFSALREKAERRGRIKHPEGDRYETAGWGDAAYPLRDFDRYTPRDLAEQTLDHTLPYEETWNENARNLVALLDAAEAVLDYENQPSRAALSKLREIVNG